MRNRLGFTQHNYCAVADPNDPKPFCYTTDVFKRWEYCDCQIIPTSTTSSTTTTTTPTPKPLDINRTGGQRSTGPVVNGRHPPIRPYNHKCGLQNSDKLKFKISCYDKKGYCYTCKHSVSSRLPKYCNGVSTRSMSSTGWRKSLPNEFQDRIYYADDTATSFDFPWFVRVGMGYFWIERYMFFLNILFLYKSCTFHSEFFKNYLTQVWTFFRVLEIDLKFFFKSDKKLVYRNYFNFRSYTGQFISLIVTSSLFERFFWCSRSFIKIEQ